MIRLPPGSAGTHTLFPYWALLRAAARRVEEVEALGVDAELHRVARGDRRAGVEAGDERGGAGRRPLARLVDGAMVDLSRELLGVLAHCRRRLDAAVDEHVGAEGFPPLDDGAAAAIGRASCRESVSHFV